MAPLENQRVYSYVGNGAPALIRRALGDQASEEMLRAGARVLPGALRRPRSGLHHALPRREGVARAAVRRGQAHGGADE